MVIAVRRFEALLIFSRRSRILVRKPGNIFTSEFHVRDVSRRYCENVKNSHKLMPRLILKKNLQLVPNLHIEQEIEGLCDKSPFSQDVKC